MANLAALLGGQHGEMRTLLAALARQPAVSETITGPQLRARRRLMRTLEHRFVAQTAQRLRYVWPALDTAWPDGSAYTSLAWDRARTIEYRMAKRAWYGERDEAVTALEDHIASEITEYVAFEERQLPRLDGPTDRTGVDGMRIADRLGTGGPWPTRPHPDLPRSRRLAALMLRPLALADRIADRLAPPRE